MKLFHQFKTRDRRKTFFKLLTVIVSGFSRDIKSQLSFQKAGALPLEVFALPKILFHDKIPATSRLQEGVTAVFLLLVVVRKSICRNVS